MNGRLLLARKKEAENQYKPPRAKIGMMISTGFLLARQEFLRRSADDKAMVFEPESSSTDCRSDRNLRLLADHPNRLSNLGRCGSGCQESVIQHSHPRNPTDNQIEESFGKSFTARTSSNRFF
mmetsp:Transcript_22636/g.53437  ORF Transcript_22636/g.53437 Transcript_22636/m.53437 type:complete len:123 (+) Transcript_22636:879-1247(+)